MNRAALLKTLRCETADRRRGSTPRWPAISLGAREIDAILPETGLATGKLHEILPVEHADFGAACGFAVALLSRILQARPGHLFWALPSYQLNAHGGIYPPGLVDFGIDPNRFIHLAVPNEQHMLWALEEALLEQEIAAAIGILPENTRLYDFTASRRLSLRAARHGVTPLILASQTGFAMASAAETRWAVNARRSAAIHYRGQYRPGLGPPNWQVALTKSKKGRTGEWLVDWDHETLSFRLSAPLADRAPERRPAALSRAPSSSAAA